MSTTYNPEAEVIAEIEELEQDARQIRRRVEHVRGPQDRRVLNRQLDEIKHRIEFLRRMVP